MRDMIPPEDRSIRNIPIPKGHHHIQREEIPQYYQPEPPHTRKRRRRPGRFILWAIVIILVCAGGVAGVSMLYAGATVVVHPRIEQVRAASTTISAQINAPVGILSYTTVSTTQWATTTVPATGTKKVSRQASGTATITSTYTANQRLVSGTRLAAPDGKIYKLASSVDAPAGGSVTVTVNAESPGTSYNKGATTFTLPGFVGDPRYTKFAIRAEELTGGFVGDEPAVAEADLEAARAELKAKLDNAASRVLETQVPETSATIPGTAKTSYSELVQTTTDDKDNATLSQSLTASVATVKIRDLASALATKLVSDYKGEAVDFLDRADFDVVASTTPGQNTIRLTMSGDTTLVWQFDPGAFTEAMQGKDKAQFETIVKSFAPAIESAVATVRPFWIKTFPTNPEQISIDIDTTE